MKRLFSTYIRLTATLEHRGNLIGEKLEAGQYHVL